ncbi:MULTISPECIES: hypothetical protein [unclassified Dyella]|uniref:hypothetical protein n=1 Tax=Dyella sp. ASV21 TaxID=2795114 RepID=UPI0018ED0F5F|nr:MULTISPECIES: hypothetical protein [unclassified Dyella]
MLKERRFYPLQVLRRLNAKDMRRMGQGDLAAVKFFTCRSRRLRVQCLVTQMGVATVPSAEVPGAFGIRFTGDDRAVFRCMRLPA